jgi:aryl-alcohol dehydrogenase-like predicted oxidoreductase
LTTYTLPHTELKVSRIAYGCMNIGRRWDRTPLTNAERTAAVDVVLAAYEAGITLFDHADIYACGKSEMAFAEVWQRLPDSASPTCGKRSYFNPSAASAWRVILTAAIRTGTI